MKKLILIFSLVISATIHAQDTSKWLRAFPITDYMVDLNDSVRVIQLEMPEGIVLKDKQLGLMYGIGDREEAVQKGYGKCHLIKGVYYYFTIGHNASGHVLKKGDLLYTFMDKTNIYYGLFPKLASHFIRLQDVYGNSYYDRFIIFSGWTEENENKLVDSLVADIRFTGKYFKENDPTMNKDLLTGKYKGQKALDLMEKCEPQTVKDFLAFVIAFPRLYAGKEWKVSEIFATWLINGSPDS